MTNQLNFAPVHNTLNWNKLWLFSKIFLSILVIVTLLSAVAEMPSVFYVFNMVLCTLFIAAILIVKIKKKQSLFVKVENNQLQYFCPLKKELVVIPINEITNITTRFCELQIHTNNRTHCINMDQIKQETQRWEVKEMIKNLPKERIAKACNF